MQPNFIMSEWKSNILDMVTKSITHIDLQVKKTFIKTFCVVIDFSNVIDEWKSAIADRTGPWLSVGRVVTLSTIHLSYYTGHEST